VKAPGLLSGFRYVNGEPGQAPVRPNISLGDTVAGIHAVLRIALVFKVWRLLINIANIPILSGRLHRKDYVMPATINLSLTDELRAFIDSNCGDGTSYVTASEFLRALIREKKERLDAADLREGIIEGYQDAIAGRTVTFNGSIRDAMKEFQEREKEGWK
jgi:Arc/MetJ-type ribon-helix-helix transcriptional regulator